MKKLPRKNCLQCGNPCKRATTKFCSTICYGKYRHENNIRIGGPPLRIKERPCQHCGTVFLPKDYKDSQRFCSQKCNGLSRTEECRQLGYSRKGHVPSLETRNKMSIAAANRKPRTVYTKGIGGIRLDIGHYVRSRWEANIARILIYENIPYKYESQIFELKDKDGSTIRYRPDFQTPSHFIEVKGWWDKKSLKIKKLMAKQHPKIRIEYITENEYKQLEQHYDKQIPEWERRT